MNIIICVFLPDVEEHHLPARIKFIRRHVTCMSWPTEPAAQTVFWITLQQALTYDIQESNMLIDGLTLDETQIL